jgi:hypothetical protein
MKKNHINIMNHIHLEVTKTILQEVGTQAVVEEEAMEDLLKAYLEDS